MAILVSPHSLRLSLSPNSSLFVGKCLRRRFQSAVKMSAVRGATSAAAAAEDGAAIVWYKHDLRVDDHPGLVAAAQQHRVVVPLYVFDHRILSRFSDEMLELLLFAVEDLRKSLKDQGANLMIRFGSAEAVIEELAKEVSATSIFAEQEVEYALRLLMDTVNEAMARISFSGKSPRVIIWDAPLYHIEDLPASYHELTKQKLHKLPPVSPPKLPKAETDLAWGSLPTMDDLRKYVDGKGDASRNRWTSIKNRSADDLLQRGLDATRTSTSDSSGKSEPSKIDINNVHYNSFRRKRPERSAFITWQRNFVGGGSSLVLTALAAYLRYLEGTAHDEWQEVHEKLREVEEREGASFGALFRPALFLGIISRRRVHYESIKFEKERNGGFLSPFGYSTLTVAAAVNSVCSMEWYWRLALKSQAHGQGNCSTRIWRWQGCLIHYTVAGHDGPAILLVHGFGAFLEHYRHNTDHIAEVGNRVWVITLLGFGKSEKPNVVYTELMWAELLRDFIIEIIGEPVYLVGNSIGGYFVAMVAGLWPALVKSVILLNSAGNVVPGYSNVNFSRDRQPSGITWLVARLLLLYLRLNIRNIVKSFYPINPERADDWLINEMLRASRDPGAIVVLESIFSFDLSVPLNWLLEGYEGKVLVIQGMKDPLSNSSSKLAMLREHCKGIVTKELDAGHCPHDEKPEVVNSIIQDWIVSIESKVSVGSTQF